MGDSQTDRQVEMKIREETGKGASGKGMKEEERHTGQDTETDKLTKVNAFRERERERERDRLKLRLVAEVEIQRTFIACKNYIR